EAVGGDRHVGDTAFAGQRPFYHRTGQPVEAQVVGQRDFAVGIPHHRDRGVILQVAADAGQVVDHLDAQLAQLVGRADAGEEHELRRVEGTTREHDLALRLNAVILAVPTVVEGNRAPVLH